MHEEGLFGRNRAAGDAESWVKSKPRANPTLQIALPAGIVLGGLALASLFPQDAGQHPPGQPPGAPIVYRRQPAVANPAQTPPDRLAPAVETVLKANPFSAGHRATVLQPVAPEAPLPRLARSFPRDPTGISSRWGISMGIGLSHADSGQQRTHRIVDGDTLPDLAQRYLGDRSRALEIFEVNRHILPSPEILPIGQEITIPGAVRPVSASSESAPAEGRGRSGQPKPSVFGSPGAADTAGSTAVGAGNGPASLPPAPSIAAP